MTHTPPSDAPALRWRMLALLATAELLGMSLWFTASAASPHLQGLWGLDGAQVGWLTTTVQLGFVAGTAAAALLGLPDLLPSRGYFATAALLAAAANAALAWAPGYEAALVSRFLTGFFLAGVYPPAMKMTATWFQAGRGLAIGMIVGALTLGKGAPYLLRLLGDGSGTTGVLVASAGAAVAAALVGIGYRDGPHPFPRRPFSLALAGAVLRDRPTRLATAGYLGHMWELYACWAWLPLFLAASAAATGGPADTGVSIAAFGAIAAGAAGCVVGGWRADRVGRARWVNLCMAASGACALGIGLLFHAPFWLLAAVAWVWGFFVVADSAQFSAMVTEVAPPHAVGTALTLQTSLGFLLTLVTIQGVPVLVDAFGWPWAFPALALGPFLGIAAIRRLRRGG